MQLSVRFSTKKLSIWYLTRNSTSSVMPGKYMALHIGQLTILPVRSGQPSHVNGYILEVLQCSAMSVSVPSAVPTSIH
jgi:hypothetical protein